MSIDSVDHTEKDTILAGLFERLTISNTLFYNKKNFLGNRLIQINDFLFAHLEIFALFEKKW